MAIETKRRLPPEIFDLPVEKMREGYYTDVYFNHARETLARGDADIVLMAAAVADYRPTEPNEEKRAKDGEPWTVTPPSNGSIARTLTVTPTAPSPCGAKVSTTCTSTASTSS